MPPPLSRRLIVCALTRTSRSGALTGGSSTPAVVSTSRLGSLESGQPVLSTAPSAPPRAGNDVGDPTGGLGVVAGGLGSSVGPVAVTSGLSGDGQAAAPAACCRAVSGQMRGALYNADGPLRSQDEGEGRCGGVLAGEGWEEGLPSSRKQLKTGQTGAVLQDSPMAACEANAGRLRGGTHNATVPLCSWGVGEDPGGGVSTGVGLEEGFPATQSRQKSGGVLPDCAVKVFDVLSQRPDVHGNVNVASGDASSGHKGPSVATVRGLEGSSPTFCSPSPTACLALPAQSAGTASALPAQSFVAASGASPSGYSTGTPPTPSTPAEPVTLSNADGSHSVLSSVTSSVREAWHLPMELSHGAGFYGFYAGG